MLLDEPLLELDLEEASDSLPLSASETGLAKWTPRVPLLELDLRMLRGASGVVDERLDEGLPEPEPDPEPEPEPEPEERRGSSREARWDEDPPEPEERS